MEKRCILCSKPVDLELSPKSNLKNILNFLYSKEKYDLAEEISRLVENELNEIRRSYRIKIQYRDLIYDVPLCKSCFRKIIKKNLNDKVVGMLGAFDKIII